MEVNKEVKSQKNSKHISSSLYYIVAELQRRIFEDFREGYLKNLL